MKSEFKAKLIQHLLSRKDSEKGFTLIELLVVVVIIGILAAIALPSFLSQINKARQGEARNYVSSAVKLYQTFFTEYGCLTANISGTATASCGGTGGGTYTVPALTSEGALKSMKYFAPEYDVQNDFSTPGTATVAPAYRGVVTAIPARNVLKGYVGFAWAAKVPGSTLPEMFAEVCEAKVSGVPTAKITVANIATAIAHGYSATSPKEWKATCANVANGPFVPLGN